MTEQEIWAKAFALQSQADWQAYQYLIKNEDLPECQWLHFLQMACEKLAKASLLESGQNPDTLYTSHVWAAKVLPTLYTDYHRSRGRVRDSGYLLRTAKQLCQEIDKLHPSADRETRPDNCEYPWEAADRVISPLDWTFHPSRLVTVPGGPTFIKLIKAAIARIIDELEN